jgi:hypothetical protein
MDSNAPYIYVYQTICESNGKSYIGVHKTDNINDGYIGCGIFRQSDAKKNLLFHNAVRKYGYASFRRYILSFYETYNDAKNEERFLVNKEWVKLKSNYNTAIGGRGNTIGWMDESKKSNWKESIRNGVNKWMSNGGRERLLEIQKTAKRNRMFGDKNPMYKKESILRRRVLQYTLSMDLVASYNSIHEAQSATGFSKGNITSCCKGKYKYCNGFIFRYENYSKSEKEQLEKNLIPKQGNRRKVVQINSLGVIVEEYSSIREAAIKTGCSNVAVEKFLSGKLKTCKGFNFKYKEVEIGC